MYNAKEVIFTFIKGFINKYSTVPLFFKFGGFKPYLKSAGFD